MFKEKKVDWTEGPQGSLLPRPLISVELEQSQPAKASDTLWHVDVKDMQ